MSIPGPYSMCLELDGPGTKPYFHGLGPGKRVPIAIPMQT